MGKRDSKNFSLNCVQICENVKTQTPTFQFFHKTKVSRWAGLPGNPPGGAVTTQGPRLGRGEKRVRLDGGGVRGPPQVLKITSLFLKKLSCICAHPGATDGLERHSRTPRLARGLRWAPAAGRWARRQEPVPCGLEWPSFQRGRLRGALRVGRRGAGGATGRDCSVPGRGPSGDRPACGGGDARDQHRGCARDVPRDTTHKPI